MELGVTPIEGPFSKYMTAQETAILVTLIGLSDPKVVIEFGCNEGVTSKRILDNVPSIEKYIGIDVAIDHVPVLGCQFWEVPKHPGAYAASDARFQLLTSPSQYLTADMLEPCDAVFIDGDHSERVVLHESNIARRLVRPGGIICWHDFQNPAVEVTRAIHKLCDQGWPINCVEHSWLAFTEVSHV